MKAPFPYFGIDNPFPMWKIINGKVRKEVIECR